MNRREFLKQGGALGAVLAAGSVAARVGSAASTAAVAATTLPTFKLGNLEVSRLILGSNPFWGYSHKSPKLDEEMKAYHTDERIVAILDEAAACGITAITSPPDERWCRLYTKYREAGGKLRIWIAQCHDRPDAIPAEIERAVKAGAQAAFIQGGRVEEQFGQGKFDVLRRWIDQIKSAGLPAGAAAHWPEIHPELLKRGFPLDFVYQCFYNVSKGETYRSAERDRAIETIKQIQIPVVAYKILAAGRLPAEEGFEFAFNNIAPKDGVCVGVFTRDAQDQIRQNATLTESLAAPRRKA